MIKSASDKTTLVVLNAGGGPGRHDIKFETLFEGQCSMYARTLNQQSEFQARHLAQEKRQLTVVDKPISIYINVYREEFPDISARIDITYIESASSQAWAKLLKDVCIKLKIDFIHSLLDRVDKTPVHRILRLRPGGDYLARQRESSSILEVINTGRTPVDVSWDITMDINDVKQSLAFDQRNMPVIDKRVASLVGKQMTRETQREIATLIMNAVSPKAAIGVMEQFHKQYMGIETEDDAPLLEGASMWSNITKYGDAIDIVTLHRLCLETLSRFVTQGRAKNVAASPCLDYVCNVIDGLRSEVDVVTMGLKLLTDVMKYLVEEREMVFHVILNCVQAYAPEATKHRPRNPRRILSPEDRMEADFAATAQSASMQKGAIYGGGGGGGGIGSSSGGGGGYGGGSVRGAVVMGEKEAVMPHDSQASLARYGDFYGRSRPLEPGAVDKMSADIKRVDDVLSRFEKEKVSVASTSKAAAVSTPDKGKQDTVPSGPTGSGDLMALVRGRVRIDHSAASHAIQNAFQTAPSTASASSASAVIKAPPRQAAAVAVDAVESEEFVRQQNEFKEKSKASKRAKYKFKLKVKSKDGSSEAQASDGGDTADESNDKKQWKGTVGVIGRRAQEKVVEMVIDFKKKIVYDHTKDSSDQEATNAAAKEEGNNGEAVEEAVIPVEVVKTEQELEAEADRAAIASVLLASAAVKKKRKKHKFALTPLPLVPCVQFRGSSGRSKQSMGMMQSFATLFKMVAQSFGNRDVAFKMGVAEEISVVVTVCQSMPRVLDYYIWIVDALYRDGFGEIPSDELDIALEDYTMVLSTDPSATQDDKDKNKKDPNTGMQFDTISEMSIPSIDADGLRSEATPVVNMGVLREDEVVTFPERNPRRISRRETAMSGAENAGDTSKVGTDDAMDENVQVPSNQIKKAANQMLVNALGLFEFEARYVARPVENIILAVAMISSHHELESREKQMAHRWLDTWDDGSRNYKLLKKKGMDLAGL